jgi:hypothetical protein
MKRFIVICILVSILTLFSLSDPLNFNVIQLLNPGIGKVYSKVPEVNPSEDIHLTDFYAEEEFLMTGRSYIGNITSTISSDAEILVL